MKRYSIFTLMCLALTCAVLTVGCEGDTPTDDTIDPPPPPPPPPAEKYVLSFEIADADTGTIEATVADEIVNSGDEFEAGTEIRIKADPANGYSFTEWQTDGITLPEGTTSEILFEMPEKDVSLTATLEAMFALINGVKWATANVDAPGTFAENAEASGMFYQWNRSTAWSSTDPRFSIPADVEWDTTSPTGSEWEKANDPCPEGWRVPTFDEALQLAYSDYVTLEWVTGAPIGVKFTDNETGDWIFLRGGSGGRLGTDLPSGSPKAGDLSNAGTGYGYYWTASLNEEGTSAQIFGFMVPFTLYPVTQDPRMGLNVRCIVDE